MCVYVRARLGRHIRTLCGNDGNVKKCVPLKPNACVRVRGADAAGSLQDCFTASGVIKSGYDEYTVRYALNASGIQRLTSRAKDCGLPASTVTLSPPPSNTCEGVMYQIQSVDRCCAPVCLRGRVSVFVHLCGWVGGWIVVLGVGVCEDDDDVGDAHVCI